MPIYGNNLSEYGKIRATYSGVFFCAIQNKQNGRLNVQPDLINILKLTCQYKTTEQILIFYHIGTDYFHI